MSQYRNKLLEHAAKVVERIFKHRIQQQIDVDDMQFGFMKGKATSDAILIVRQMQEKFRAKGKKLYFGFVYLEKAFERFPREEMRWAMCKLRVEEWLVLAVMSVCAGAETVVGTLYGGSDDFGVGVSMHQGSALGLCCLWLSWRLCLQSSRLLYHGSCCTQMTWL